VKIDPEIIKSMNMEVKPERIQVNTSLCKDVLDFIKQSSDRIIKKSDLYVTSEDADVQCDCIDIVAFRLNDFVQSFIDLVSFISKKEGVFNRGDSAVSLRYCISLYEKIFDGLTDKENMFLEKILLRNEITHDYFNREYHQEELKSLMVSCASGSVDVVERLYSYCANKELLNEKIK